MSATIEERVVAMKFDNSNFEKNVKTSMSTLDKLKEALNFNSAKNSVKTLNEATKSVDFSKMANSIDSISDRFSALGVVGMSVLNNLTNKATDAALNILGKVPSMIIEGGWKRASDVEQGRFTLQGLVDDAETVEALMAAARESVNETAYAANEAIKAASVFAASGVTDAEKMQYVLKGVAGVAATTNSNYEDIARIFETVSGQGRIMGEQLNQLAVRGLNAAAVLANYFGTSEAEIRELVSQGEVSFDLFSEAMTETFGEHAKDANKTFSGSMANIRAALARTGEAFFKHLIVQEGPAVQLFNAIRIKINEMNNAWAPAAEEAAKAVNKIIDSFRGLIEQVPMTEITNTLINSFKILFNILRPFAQIITSIGSAFIDAFDFGNMAKDVDAFVGKIELFTRGLSFSGEAVKGISKLFKGFFDIIAAVGDIIFGLISQIKIAEAPFQSFTDIIGKFLYRIGMVLSTIGGMIRRSENLRTVFSKLADTLSGFGKTIGSAFKGIAEIFENIAKTSMLAGYNIGSFIGSLAVKALEIFATALEKIVYFLDLFAKYIVVPALETFAGLIGNAVRSLQEFFNEIRKSERIKKAFEKISSAMERLFTAVKNVFKPLGDMFSNFHDNADKAADSVGSFLGSLAIDTLTIFVEALAKVVEFLEKVAEKFVIPALDIFIENVGIATGKLVEFAQTHSFTDVLDNIKEKLGAVAEGFKGFFSSLDENDGILYRAVEGLKKMYENFKLLQGGASAHTLYDEETGEFIETVDEVSDKESIISKIGNAFKTFGENVKDAMTKAFEAVKNFIDYIFNTDPKQIAEDIKESLIKLKDKLSELIDKFKSWADITGESAEGIKNPFERATTAIKNFFTELDTDKIIAIIFTGVMIGMLVSILKLTNAFTGLLKGITTLIDGFKNVTDSISGFFKSITNPFKKSKIVEFAQAILLVAAAIAILTLVDQSKLWSAVGAISAISAVIVALTAVLAIVAGSLKKQEAEEMFKRLSKMIISIAASVLILTAAVKILEGVDFLKSQKAVLVIAELAAVMIAASLALTKFAKGGVKGFLVMLGFAIVIGKVAKALKTIADINFKNIQENLEGFAVAIGGLALVAFAASNLRLTSGLGLLIFTYALEKVLPMLNELALEVNVQNILNLVKDNIDLVYQIGGLVAAMIVVSGIFGKGIRRFGTGMILLGIATGIMAHAIKTISSIDLESLRTGAKVLTGIMTIFGILSIIFQLSDGENHAIRIAAAIGILSLCLYPIAGAIWVLGTMNPDKARQGLFAVSVIMALFALIIAAANSGEGATKIGTMIVITIAVVSLMGEMIALTFIPYDQILSAAGSMAAVMLSFAAVLYAIGKIGKVNPSVMFALLEVAALTALLAYELYRLSDQPWDGLVGAGVGMAAVILALAGAVKIMNKVDWKEALGNATACIYLAIALLPIGYAIYKMSDQPWQGMVGAAAAMGIVLLALAGAIKIMDKVDWKNAIGDATACIVLCVALLPIGIALWKLSEYNWQGMLGAAAAMGIMLLALGASIRIMNGIDWQNAIGDAVGALILSVALFPIAMAINMLKDKPFKQYMGAAVSMGLLLVALGASVRIMNGVNWKSAIPGAAACLILSVACIPIALAMNQLRGFKWQDMLGAAVALSIVLGAMTVITEVLSIFRVNAGAAIEGALVVVAVTTIIIGLTGLLAGLAGWLISDSMAAYIERGLDLIILIAGKLGDAIGAFIGGVIGGAGMKILEDIGLGLQKFATLSDPFFQWLKTMDDSVIDGIVIVAETMLALGLSEVIGAITSFLGLPGLLTLKAQMERLGTGVKAFSDAVTGLSMEDAKTASEVAETLLSINPPAQGGFMDKVLGSKNFELFNDKKLGEEGLGGGIKAFAECVKDITKEAAEAGVAVAQAIFELHPPNEGGWLADIVGDNNFDLFNKKKLGADGLGGGIRAFVNTVKELDFEDAKNGIEIAKKLFALHPPNEGGWLADIVGDNNFDLFNKKKLGAEGLGGGIRAFTNTVKELSMEDAKIGIEIAKYLFLLHPPNEGGWIGKWMGENSFELFNADKLGINGLGGGIAAFCEAVSGIDNIESALYAAQALEILTAIKIPDEKDGFFDWLDKKLYGDNSNFDAFNKILTGLGNGLLAFYTAVKDVDMDTSKDAEKIIYNLGKSIYNMKSLDFSKVDEFVTAIGKLATDAVKKFCDSLNSDDSKTKIDAAMNDFMNKVISSIRSNKTTAISEIGSFSDEMVNTYSDEFMANEPYVNSNMESFVQGNYGAFTGVNGLNINGDYSQLFGDGGDIASSSFDESFMSNLPDSMANMEAFAQGDYSAFIGKDGFDFSGDYSNIYGGTAQSLYDSFDGTFMGNLNDSMANMESFANGAIGSLSGTLNSSVNLSQIESSTKAITDKINSITENDISTEKMEGYVKNFVDGTDSGVNKWVHIAENAASKLAARINARFASDEGINSPSKVYAEYGKYLDKGLAIGIDDYASEPVEAIGNVGSSMYDSLRDAMDESSNYISESVDLSPTITPYVDITGAMRDVQQLNSMFDDTLLAYDMQSRFGDMGRDGEAVDATNSDVVSAITTLRGDLSDLKKVVGNLKVIMDTGTLVGEIAPGMDSALGQMAMLKRRGV